LIVSVPAVLLLAVAVVVLCRWAGLKPWHAGVCVLFGFYLASSSLAPHSRAWVARWPEPWRADDWQSSSTAGRYGPARTGGGAF
jgi:hypothetical protein